MRQISAGLSKHHATAFDVAVVYERTIDVAAERERLTRDIAKYEKGLAAAERQLGNEGFLGKAPAQVVEGLKKQEAETRMLLEKARAAWEALAESMMGCSGFPSFRQKPRKDGAPRLAVLTEANEKQPQILRCAQDDKLWQLTTDRCSPIAGH